MTTRLEAPVYRELEYEVQGRSVIVGLEIRNERPVLSVRLKGRRSGWMVDLRQLADAFGAGVRTTDWQLMPPSSRLIDPKDPKYTRKYPYLTKGPPNE